MSNHESFIQRCLQLAQQAAAEGESPVGCVIVKDDVIIAEAFEQSRRLKDITRHAETLAILNAINDHGNCEDTILYSNVEPCILCSYVIRHHKIKQVVFSKACGELGGTGPRFPILTAKLTSWGKAPLVTRYP
ncbi:MAG: nucleoside deaminase [Mucilaginibacter sp.]|nr:nucleoside deaminase [Mucilaginibacter sp.]